MVSIPRPEYPRPDFMRKDWQSLNGEWEFSFDKPVYDRTITVPFCYQSKASGIGDTQDHYEVWYRRSFEADAEKLRQGRLLLHFGAVDYIAKVWVNGVPAGGHQGGHTSFALDITDAARPGENELVVLAADSLCTDKPRGKQSWTGEPFGCWYTPTTGIWQSVWLEYAGKTYLQRIKITPDLTSLSAECELFLSANVEAVATLRPSLEKNGKRTEMGRIDVICRNGYGRGIIALADLDILRGDLIWSPESPNLIDVEVTVRNEGSPNDEVTTYFGLRSIGASAGQAMLNNAFYYQRLVLDQGYWPDSLLTPPSDEAIIADIRLTKEMGFNGARKHQKIEDPRYYYWADKLGLLVWGEMPSAYMFNDRAVANTATELMEFISRDYNHPCIVAWVPANESWGVRNVMVNTRQQDYLRALTYLIKAVDPLRLVSGNDGWEQIGETDICAIHDYSLFPSTIGKYDDTDKLLATQAESRSIYAEGQSHSGQPVMMTEYGGVSFAADAEAGWGYYKGVASVREFLDRVEPVTTFLLQSGKFTGFCYTQLTDVMQEVNGLLRSDRTPKVPLEELLAVFGRAIYEA